MIKISIKTFDYLNQVTKFEWSSCGKILAVGGYCTKEATSFLDSPKCSKSITEASDDVDYLNYIHFYNLQGCLLFKIQVPKIVRFFIKYNLKNFK